MATVTLDEVRLGLATDLANQINVGASDISAGTAVAGDVRMYANGRFRAVQRSGTSRTVPLKLWVTDRAQLTKVLDWVGSTVLYRDPRGRKVWGVYFAVDVDENIGADLAAVSLTITEVTYDESV